ncbi:SAF domain-containing protein [Homoserinimonas sp. OAct 916]|uniref:SAF domain-containing protein n=1 Tax=Homoserinimonas sp. OAct 916 TaxID=2211450 RepID=UPI001E288F42|nr:SAF domain-containing protein [Homoserinimonas sp. OAct 916]
MAEATSGKSSGRSGAGAALQRHGRWIDVRLIVGVVLVAVSIAGVSLIVTLADRTIPIYAARIDLAAGEVVTADKLVVADVQLGSRSASYVQPGDLDRGQAVAVRPIAAGDLVPTSALGAQMGVQMTSVVVTLAGQASAAVDTGAVVDVWAASSRDRARFDTPTVLVSEASVVRLFESDGFMRSGEKQVELLIPKARVPDVLEAIANSDALALIPVHQKWQR